MDVFVQLLLVIVGAILGALATWAVGRGKAKRDAATEYLEAVCVALDGMTQDFRERRVPHRSGRTFVRTLDVFKDYMQAHLRGDTEKHIHKLRTLAEEAQNIDDDLYRDHESQEEITRWVRSAERVMGDLEAEIARMKGKQ
jgi:hypothetical protein